MGGGDWDCWGCGRGECARIAVSKRGVIPKLTELDFFVFFALLQTPLVFQKANGFDYVCGTDLEHYLVPRC